MKRYIALLAAYLGFIWLPAISQFQKLYFLFALSTFVWLVVAIFWGRILHISVNRKLVLNRFVWTVFVASSLAFIRGALLLMGIDHPYISIGLTLFLAILFFDASKELWDKQ